MKFDKNSLTLNRIILYPLSMLGISFWFFIGFPFGNHNESYIWFTILDTASINKVLFERIVAVSYRPLGQLFAYILYNIDNNQIYFVQIFNYAMCVWSFFYILKYIPQKYIFSILCLISGFVYFSGFVYLFHIHGIFYSPLLLNIGILYSLFECYDVPYNKKLLLTVIATLFFSMFHPFALPISITYLYGHSVENIKNIGRNNIIILFLIGICSLLLAVWIWGGNTGIGINNFKGLIYSYKTVEVNSITSLLSVILCILVIISFEKIYLRIIFFILTMMAVAYFYYIKIPCLIIWIVLVLIKLTYNKYWSLYFLLLSF
jgi:hypothetical protein